jgi:hypothetical protein
MLSLRLCTLPTERQRGYGLTLRGLLAPCQWVDAAFRRRPCGKGGEVRHAPAERFSWSEGLLDAAAKQGIVTAVVALRFVAGSGVAGPTVLPRLR